MRRASGRTAQADRRPVAGGEARTAGRPGASGSAPAARRLGAAGAAGTVATGVSRRAFCAAGGAGALALTAGALAGCASGAPGAGGASSSLDAPAGSAPAGERGLSASASEATAPSASADASGADGGQPASRAFFAFDSLVSVKAYGASEELLDEVQQMCERYDGLFSAHSDSSDVARVNAAGGAPTEVDQDTADLITEALSLCDEFGGAFDVTIGAVSLQWDFQNGVKPADEDIEAALPHVDWHGVSVDGTTVTLADPQARLDLGGMAKGWICDRVVEALRAGGVTSGIVNLGTSSDYVMGTKPDGAPWGVGIRDPRGSLGSLMAKLSLAETAVTSSGLYDQHFELDGVDYWHILDPATGYPVKTDMLGVTVVGASATEGDAMSTALFVMGTERAREWLAEHRPEVGALFIGDDGGATFTDGFEQRYGYVELADPSASASAGA